MEEDTIGCSEYRNATTNSTSYEPTPASPILESITSPLHLLYKSAIQTITSHPPPASYTAKRDPLRPTTSTQPVRTKYLDCSTTKAATASSPVSNTTRTITALKDRRNTPASQCNSNHSLAYLSLYRSDPRGQCGHRRIFRS